MAVGTPGSAGGRAALARSLVPSIVILGGVFWFINSACLAEEDDNYAGTGYNPPCEYDEELTTPPGSRATFIAPSNDQVFAGPFIDGLTRVRLELTADEIDIAPAGGCRFRSGHFRFSIERTGAGCVSPSLLEPFELLDGAMQHDLSLPAGTYVVTAQIVNGNSEPYQPEVVARVRFTIEGPAPGVDGGLCP